MWGELRLPPPPLRSACANESSLLTYAYPLKSLAGPRRVPAERHRSPSGRAGQPAERQRKGRGVPPEPLGPPAPPDLGRWLRCPPPDKAEAQAERCARQVQQQAEPACSCVRSALPIGSLDAGKGFLSGHSGTRLRRGWVAQAGRGMVRGHDQPYPKPSNRDSTGLVTQRHRPRPELLAAHEPQLEPLAQAGEQCRPVARQDGLHDKLVLIDQSQIRLILNVTVEPIASCTRVTPGSRGRMSLVAYAKKALPELGC